MECDRHHRIRRALVSVFVGATVALTVGYFAARAWARPAKVTWEAEKPTVREDPWVVKSASATEKTKRLVAGDAYIRHPMLWPPKGRPKDAKVAPAQLVYEFNVPSTEVYYFWARVYWYD